MIAINHLYKGSAALRSVLNQQYLGNGSQCLVKIFTSCMDRKEALDTAKLVKELLPCAHIIGATAAGIIFEGQQYENKTMVLVEKYESLQITARTFSWDKKPARQLAQEVSAAFHPAKHELVHILFSDR